MQREDWIGIVKAAAPAVATALGGPLAGVAVSTLSDAILGKPDGTEDEIGKALMIGGQDALVRLKQVEADFTAKMRELDIDLERIHSEDRIAARQREAATGDTFTPRTLAFAVTAGFFGVLGYLLYEGKPTNGGDALLVMLGALGGAWTSIISYYFGSSAGSADKTALLARSK